MILGFGFRFWPALKSARTLWNSGQHPGSVSGSFHFHCIAWDSIGLAGAYASKPSKPQGLKPKCIACF